MTKKQKIWGIIILLIIGANLLLFTVLNKKSEKEVPPTIVAMSPLKQPDQIYRMQFYARGSQCGFYINDQLVYDTYEASIGSMSADFLDNINEFLQNGDNRLALKLRSHGDYFEPGHDYQCKVSVSAGRGRAISEKVAYLNVDYAGQDHFTMGDSADFDYKVETNFIPYFEISISDQGEKEAIVSGTLTFHNLPDLKE